MSNFILSVAFLMLCVKSALCDFPVQPCIPKSECSCRNVDGLIDLHPLANTDGTPRFRDIPDPDGKTFYSWNPCYGFDEVGCKNVAMCQIKEQGSTSVSLGPQSSLVYVASSLYGQVFQYTQWGGVNNSGSVILTCDEGEEGIVTRRPDSDFGAHDFYLELRSKYACPVQTNGSTPASSTSRPTPERRATTPAFIGTAKTPTTTKKPMFDLDDVSMLMVGVLVILVILFLTIAIFFYYIVSRLNTALSGNSGSNVDYGSQAPVNEKLPIIGSVP